MKILKILLCLCISLSTMQPFTPLAIKLNSNLTTTNIEDDSNGEDNNTEILDNETQEKSEDTEEQKYDAIASNFNTMDLDGYCTIDVPLSHFSVDSSSTNTYKKLIYKDNKTRLNISYITGMDKNTDIPGYISKEVAGVNTTTNNQTEEDYNGVRWIKISADEQEDWCNTYIWYTLNKDETSAVWIRADVLKDSDEKAFYDIMTQMLNTYNLYVVSGTLFDTPTTGIYKDKSEDETVADTSEYKANDSDRNTVFKSHGGYVLGADIANNWDSMEIIIDGTKFALPTSLKTFEKAGFYINDRNIETNDDLDVYPGDSLSIQIQNKNGTVLKVICCNDSALKTKNARKCPVQGLIIDYSQYVNVKANDVNEIYNEETDHSDMAAKNAKDGFNHELILPGGITWGVYVDDLKRYYGNCISEGFDATIQQHRWTSGNKTMIIRTDVINQIKYIKLTCSESAE